MRSIIFLVIDMMIVNVALNGRFSNYGLERDATPEEIAAVSAGQKFKFELYNYINKSVYTLFIIGIGYFFQGLMAKIVEIQNFRF